MSIGRLRKIIAETVRETLEAPALTLRVFKKAGGGDTWDTWRVDDAGGKPLTALRKLRTPVMGQDAEGVLAAAATGLEAEANKLESEAAADEARGNALVAQADRLGGEDVRAKGERLLDRAAEKSSLVAALRGPLDDVEFVQPEASW